uniref:EF-hand domain-containing protein n=1 Tax=Macrostomum lignano TaxID=282301 RepID=A0A1I8G6G0_9PLAT
MGNTCGNGAAARRRVGLMERHTLSEEQMAKLEAMFKKAAKGKRYISFKEFLELYPESKLQRDESDMRSVYYAFADSRTNSLKFDGFVMLMLLSNRVGSLDESERM